MNKLQHENQEGIRGSLRTIGVALVVVGGVLTAIGLIDFFSAFGSFRAPTMFWAAFIGLPMIGVGLNLAKFGYMGAVGRYVAGEVAPVAKDTINYIAEGSVDTIQNIAKAVSDGKGTGATLVRCHKCNADNALNAKFCNHCGAALLKAKECEHCHELNDPDARFCDNCGRSF
jgi:ribosomal protein L40E